MLTQQKYNDAAVKQFFRKAAGEDKAVVVVFNQCLLPEDEQFWPLWLETFSRETGIRPDLLYLAPNDRRAAEQNQLPFFERRWPRDSASTEDHPAEPRNLARDLSEMRFHEIKLRTLRGALSQLLSRESGAPAHLDEIRLRSAAFQDAARLFSTQELARIENWPAPPTSLLVQEIREWWRTHRTGLTKTVHDFYGKIGTGLFWPIRWVGERIGGKTPDPRNVYRESERNVMLVAIDSLYSELTRLSQLGNDLLKPRLEALLAGASRAALLSQLSAALDQLDLDRELAEVVADRMQSFRSESPSTFGMFRKLDAVAATIRPMSSVVSLYFGGTMGHALMGAQSLAVHVIGDIAGGTGAVAVGETALTGMAGGFRLLEARFRELQSAFTQRRVAWFASFLHERVLGNLHAELTASGNLPQTPAYQEVDEIVIRLAKGLNLSTNL